MMARPLRDLSEVMRDGARQGERIVDVLSAGPKTIPEIAEALHAPPREVLLWVMALRRFGRVVEAPKGTADEYYRYRRKEAGP